MKTELLLPDKDGIARVVELWRKGGLVAFPTETVYGLGGDASNGNAVARIYEAKCRPSFNPLIIHVADLAQARKYAEFDALARQLAEAFWPGPLSLVLPIKPGVELSPLVTAGLDTIAVRVPENPLAQKLLREFGGAIAAPSANPSGRLSPSTAAHVMDGLAGRIDAVINGGACAVGLESTIVHPGSAPPALLRPGGLPVEALEAMLGQKMARPDDPDQPISPGQLASHYAPGLPVQRDVTAPDPHAIWLGFGPNCGASARNLSHNADLREAAANLFGMLHELDGMAKKSGAKVIQIAPIPNTGIGAAINDRLSRAAAPR